MKQTTEVLQKLYSNNDSNNYHLWNIRQFMDIDCIYSKVNVATALVI